MVKRTWVPRISREGKHHVEKKTCKVDKRRGNGKEMARSTIDSLAVHPCNPGYPRVDFLLPGRLIYLPKPWWRLIYKSYWPSLRHCPIPTLVIVCAGWIALASLSRLLALPLPLCKLEKPFQVYLDAAKRQVGSPAYYKGQRKPGGTLNFLTSYLRDIPDAWKIEITRLRAAG